MRPEHVAPEPTLIAFPTPGAPRGEWQAISQQFTYLHPVNGREYAAQIIHEGDTKAEALEKAQADLDAFMVDRGNTVLEVTPFTEVELTRAKG